MPGKEPALIQDINWTLDYRVRLGRAWSAFMRGLAERKLLATHCAMCGRTYVPPQSYCESCYAPIEEWREIEPVGTLRAATIAYQGFEGGPAAPYAVGAINVDGTDSLLMHFLGGVDLSCAADARRALRNGVRVRAVWARERRAAITDIEHFELAL
jgi:uncharacterized protein